MNIGLNCQSFLKSQQAGIGRYGYNLVRTLSEIDRENEYFLYARRFFFDRKKRVPRFPADNFHVKVDPFHWGPKALLRGLDVYHALSPEPIQARARHFVVTIHDVIHRAFPEGHTPGAIEQTEAHLKNILKVADRIIAVSKNTVSDLKRYYAIDDKKLRMIYHGVDRDVFYPLGEFELSPARSLVRHKGLEGPFLLHVGTLEPRKNLTGVIRALAILKSRRLFPGKLAVIGMKGWMDSPIYQLVDELGLREEVVFLGYLSNDELRYFYNLAEMFVFPSFYEGFGFPILEALSCGAAVVTSNAASCPEVAGDAALIVDPRDPEEIARAVERILTNPELKEHLRQKALHRALYFSFVNTAKETLRVYREVCNS